MKLTTCVIGNDVERDLLIKQISNCSDRRGDKLVDFMDQYHLNNLQSATVEQLKEYIANCLHQNKIDGTTL